MEGMVSIGVYGIVIALHSSALGPTSLSDHQLSPVVKATVTFPFIAISIQMHQFSKNDSQINKSRFIQYITKNLTIDLVCVT